MVNGSFFFVEVNGDEVGLFLVSFWKCDIIIIIGFKDNVEVVKEVLLVCRYVFLVEGVVICVKLMRFCVFELFNV